jgi:hypothetical protein
LTIGNGGFEHFKSWSAFEGGCEGCEIKDPEDCGDGDFRLKTSEPWSLRVSTQATTVAGVERDRFQGLR